MCSVAGLMMWSVSLVLVLLSISGPGLLVQGLKTQFRSITTLATLSNFTITKQKLAHETSLYWLTLSYQYQIGGGGDYNLMNCTGQEIYAPSVNENDRRKSIDYDELLRWAQQLSANLTSVYIDPASIPQPPNRCSADTITFIVPIEDALDSLGLSCTLITFIVAGIVHCMIVESSKKRRPGPDDGVVGDGMACTAKGGDGLIQELAQAVVGHRVWIGTNAIERSGDPSGEPHTGYVFPLETRTGMFASWWVKYYVVMTAYVLAIGVVPQLLRRWWIPAYIQLSESSADLNRLLIVLGVAIMVISSYRAIRNYLIACGPVESARVFISGSRPHMIRGAPTRIAAVIRLRGAVVSPPPLRPLIISLSLQCIRSHSDGYEWDSDDAHDKEPPYHQVVWQSAKHYQFTREQLIRSCSSNAVHVSHTFVTPDDARPSFIAHQPGNLFRGDRYRWVVVVRAVSPSSLAPGAGEEVWRTAHLELIYSVPLRAQLNVGA